MALLFQGGDTVKQALYDELTNLLSADGDVRTAAEQRIKQLKFTEGYGVYLAECSMNQAFDLAMRQMASVMLTKYVEEHWVSTPPKHKATDQAKDMIRKILPNGLYDPNSKIRVSIAYTISTIANTDWPFMWSDLFDIIVKCLGGNEDSIHGAMQVLVEFTYDVHSKITEIGPVILNEIHRIFDSVDTYSVKTRSCAVTIFKTLITAINEQVGSKEEWSQMLDHVLPVFVNKLVLALATPCGPHSSFAMKTEIIKVLTYMIMGMHRFILRNHKEILPSVWQLLTNMANIYVNVVVNETSPALIDNNEEDDELTNFTTLILQIYEFIHTICEHMRFKALLRPALTELVYITIVYMQITAEQSITWEDDPASYADDFNSFEGSDFSIRSTCVEFLQILADEFNDTHVLQAFANALKSHIEIAEAGRNTDNPNWWKLSESAITASHSVKKFFGPEYRYNPAIFNIHEFLAYVRSMLGPGVNGFEFPYNVSPYLYGRALWTLTAFAKVEYEIFDRDQLQVVLDSMASNFANTKPMVVQICAFKSLQELCENLKSSDEQRNMLTEKLETFMNFMTDIGTRSKGSALYDLLATVSVVVAHDKHFTATNNERVINFAAALFVRYYEDPFVLGHIQDIVSAMCTNEFCIPALQERFIPTLMNVLSHERTTENDGKHMLQDTAIAIIGSIVKHSPVPLSDILMNTAFPATIQCILNTDDHELLQSGGECLRCFISASPQQICSYNNGQGMELIMQVAHVLLNPRFNEKTAMFVGHLVVTIVSKASNYLGENVNLLLKSVISKLQLVESLSVTMSLVIIFAHLFVTQMEAIMNFLSTVPGPTGEPAMQYVLSVWLPRQLSFYGTYERKISTLALCQIFEYGINSNDTRITSIQIRDLAEQTNNGNRPHTRQQAANAPQHWVNYPVMAKIFKILIREMGMLEESILEEDVFSEEDEMPDQEPAADPNNDSSPPKYRLADMWYTGGEDDDEEDDDQLLKELESDPIFQGDMKDKLRTFLQNFMKAEQFNEYLQYLNEDEQKILQSIQAP